MKNSDTHQKVLLHLLQLHNQMIYIIDIVKDEAGIFFSVLAVTIDDHGQIISLLFSIKIKHCGTPLTTPSGKTFIRKFTETSSGLLLKYSIFVAASEGL